MLKHFLNMLLIIGTGSCHFCEIWLPFGFERPEKITSEKINHKSAVDHPDHPDHYISEEIKNGVMLGPFA